jgi:hypothetical protein
MDIPTKVAYACNILFIDSSPRRDRECGDASRGLFKGISYPQDHILARVCRRSSSR